MKSILFDDILSPIDTSNVSGTSGDAIVWAFVLDVCSDVVEFYHHQDVWQTVLPIRFVLIGYVVSFSGERCPTRIVFVVSLIFLGRRRPCKAGRSTPFAPHEDKQILQIQSEERFKESAYRTRKMLSVGV